MKENSIKPFSSSSQTKNTGSWYWKKKSRQFKSTWRVSCLWIRELCNLIVLQATRNISTGDASSSLTEESWSYQAFCLKNNLKQFLQLKVMASLFLSIATMITFSHITVFYSTVSNKQDKGRGGSLSELIMCNSSCDCDWLGSPTLQ